MPRTRRRNKLKNRLNLIYGHDAIEQTLICAIESKQIV